jgi:hypothetical protein
LELRELHLERHRGERAERAVGILALVHGQDMDAGRSDLLDGALKAPQFGGIDRRHQ